MAADELKGNDIFTCRLCGACCIGFGGTYINEADIVRIAAFVGRTRDAFIRDCCVPSGSRQVLAQKHDGTCLFFDPEAQCTIHPVKPKMCRAWPFIRAVAAHPENWNIMAGSCPGMVQNVSHADLTRIVLEELKKNTG